MKDRGMKKWMAYRSLPEQERYLQSMQRERAFVERPLISESTAEEINTVLTSYQGQTVSVRFYCNGAVRETIGTIHHIDSVFKAIQINAMTIVFANILGINYV